MALVFSEALLVISLPILLVNWSGLNSKGSAIILGDEGQGQGPGGRLPREG